MAEEVSQPTFIEKQTAQGMAGLFAEIGSLALHLARANEFPSEEA
jgi:hypothetical protein